MYIVRGFGVSPITVKRNVKRFRAGGPGAFFGGRKAKRPTVWTPEVLNRAQELFNEGKSRKAVEDLLEIKPDTLYRAIRSGRLAESQKKSPEAKANEA